MTFQEKNIENIIFNIRLQLVLILTGQFLKIIKC